MTEKKTLKIANLTYYIFISTLSMLVKVDKNMVNFIQVTVFSL